MIFEDSKYNIVIPDDSGLSLDELKRSEVEDLSTLIRMGGKYSWTLQTYCYLKREGLSIQLSHEIKPQCVNLAHGNFLRAAEKRWDFFSVSIQGDYPHFPLAQHHVVQNVDQVKKRASFVPLWPQVGQIPRDPARKGVSVVAFQGRLEFTDLDVDQLNRDLNTHGIRFVALDNWQDLSGVDVLVGIRHYGKKRYRRKPASKLVNAWHANIPMIGGWDSAYSHIGTPGKNYLRVSSHDELVAAVLMLKNNPDAYDKIVAAGAKEVGQYTAEAITKRWVRLLEDEVYPKYLAWRSRPAFARLSHAVVLANYRLVSSVKYLFRTTYKIPVIKRVRDLYYDPVR